MRLLRNFRDSCPAPSILPKINICFAATVGVKSFEPKIESSARLFRGTIRNLKIAHSRVGQSAVSYTLTSTGKVRGEVSLQKRLGEDEDALPTSIAVGHPSTKQPTHSFKPSGGQLMELRIS